MSSDPTRKRKYVVLSDDEWQHVLALFAKGVTLKELAAKYGVSTRSIQLRLAEAAPAPAPGVARREPQAPLVRLAGMATGDRHHWIREAGIADAEVMRSLLMENLALLHADPDLPPSAKIRSIGEAATARARLDTMLREAAGLTADMVNEADLPMLPIRVLSEAEVEEMRNRQEIEDGGASFDEADLQDALDEAEAEPSEIVDEGEGEP
jgi:hypothetical protein